MSSLSIRGSRLANLPKAYYFKRLFEAISDPWSPENPDGFIMAAVAENGVSSHLILERLQSNSEASSIPPEALKYNDMKGWLELRTALCDVLSRTSMSGLDLAAENLVLSAGLSSVLDQLFYCIADENATCLVPAPYYPMFDQDLGLKNMVHVRPVALTNAEADIQELDAAWRASQAQRQPVRAVLITNPDNPTGVVLSDDRMRAIIRWCVRKRVHCIVDEVYALSVFPHDAPLRSALAVAVEVSGELDEKQTEVLWEHMHVLVAVSKDFCASGLRVGGLYTYNADLIHAYDEVAHFCTPSGLTQWQLVSLLRDEAFVDSFIAENSSNLQANCQIVLDGLDHIGVPYVRPQGGFFVWMSLKHVLQIDTFEREAELWHGIFDKAKIFMVPGEACHAREPGHYRVCFAAHPADAMHDFVARLKHFIDQYKTRNERQNWSTQNFMLKAGFGTGR